LSRDVASASRSRFLAAGYTSIEAVRDDLDELWSLVPAVVGIGIDLLAGAREIGDAVLELTANPSA
jgi:hypothetical protein